MEMNMDIFWFEMAVASQKELELKPITANRLL
jgi:hypothetical protein